MILEYTLLSEGKRKNPAKLRRYVKRAKWFIYYWIVILTRQVVLLLPRGLALGLGMILGDLFFVLAHKERRRSIENLHIAFGRENNYGNILRICRRCFENLGKGLMEVMQFPKLTLENLRKFVTFEGTHNLDNALKTGKGVIVITAHFGNWELLGASFALSGYRVNTITRPVRSYRLDELIRRNRESVGLKCIPRGAFIKSMIGCLRRNEILAFLADVDTKVDGVFVNFFGHPAFTPKGPASIALRTDSALVPIFLVRQKDDTHKAIVEKPLELKRSDNLEEDIRVNTAMFTKVIEDYVRRYPEQWLWFQQRWRTLQTVGG